jgi:hypothetical protein
MQGPSIQRVTGREAESRRNFSVEVSKTELFIQRHILSRRRHQKISKSEMLPCYVTVREESFHVEPILWIFNLNPFIKYGLQN